jgi:hypothetical protein
MRRIYVSTVFRREDERGEQGKLYAFDWDTKTLIWQTDHKSLRGMCFFNGKFLVADFQNGIHAVDELTGTITDSWLYPEIKFLHRLYVHDDKLWVPSTGNDCLVIIDSNMSVSEVRDLTGSGIDTQHFNSIGWDDAGNRYYLFFETGLIYSCSAGKPISDLFYGSHDLDLLKDSQFIVNMSGERKVVLYNAADNTVQDIYQAPEGPSTTVSKWGWTRGVAVTPDRRYVFTGSAPVDIHMFEVDTWHKKDWLRISNTVEESIFDIQLDPRDWGT